MSFSTTPTDLMLTRLARRAVSPIYIVTIEGLGDSSGQFKLCTRVPAYARGDARYKPWLFDVPKSIAQEIDIVHGGISKRGNLSFRVQDVAEFHGDIGGFTRATLEHEAFTLVRGTRIASGSTTFELNDVTGVVSGTVLHVNREAMIVTALSGSTVTVMRGQLGTRQETHNWGGNTDAIEVFRDTNPVLNQRRVELAVTFDDVAEVDELRLETGYRIGSAHEISVGGDLHVLSCRSEDDILDGVVLSNDNIEGSLGLFYGDHTFVTNVTDNAKMERSNIWRSPDGVADENSVFLRLGGDGGEIVQGKWTANAQQGDAFGFSFKTVPNGRRAALETSQQELKVTGDPNDSSRLVGFREVIVARVGGPRYDSNGVPICGGAFRFEAPGAEGGARSAWRASDHPIVVMLCLMVGSRQVGDRLQFNNYIAGKGNFSGLRVGVGLGLPASLVNWDSFLRVWEATPDYHVRNFIIQESEPFSELVDREILKPFGWTLRIRGGLIELSTFRAGTGEATDGDILDGNDIILDGQGKPQLAVRIPLSDVASAVALKLKRPDGSKAPDFTLHDFDFPHVFGDARFAEYRGRPITIECSSIDRDDLTTVAEMTNMMLDLLIRFRRPWSEVELTTGMEWATRLSLGDVCFLTVPWLIDRRTGTRGWSDVGMQAVKKTLRLDRWTIDWEFVAHPARRRIPLVTPSIIVSTTADVSGSVEFTASANVFTTPGLRFGGIGADGDGFRVGDVVRLVDSSGRPVTTQVGTVTYASGSIVRTTTELSGVAGSGCILEWADAGVASTSQQVSGSYLARRDTLTVVSASSAFRSFGHPLW